MPVTVRLLLLACLSLLAFEIDGEYLCGDGAGVLASELHTFYERVVKIHVVIENCLAPQAIKSIIRSTDVPSKSTFLN